MGALVEDELADGILRHFLWNPAGKVIRRGLRQNGGGVHPYAHVRADAEEQLSAEGRGHRGRGRAYVDAQNAVLGSQRAAEVADDLPLRLRGGEDAPSRVAGQLAETADLREAQLFKDLRQFHARRFRVFRPELGHEVRRGMDDGVLAELFLNFLLQRGVADVQHAGPEVRGEELRGEANRLDELEERVARAALGPARDQDQVRVGGEEGIDLLLGAAAVAQAERLHDRDVAGGGEAPRALQRDVGQEAREHGAHRGTRAGGGDEQVGAAPVRGRGHDQPRGFVEHRAPGDGLQFRQGVAHPLRGF